MGRAHRIRFAERPPERETPTTCWLCGRPLGLKVQWHHPRPRARGGKATEPVHPICHRAIHAAFTNKELEARFTDAAALRAAMPKFIAWIADKPADFNAPTRNAQREAAPSWRLLNQEA